MSLPDIGEAIARLKNQSHRLNALTDAAGAIVRRVEDFLNSECSVGSPCSVTVRSDDPEDPVGGTFLTYRRVGPRYRIAVLEVNHHDEITSIKPWSDCTRADKLDSVKFLPILLSKVAGQVEQDVTSAERSLQEVTNLLSLIPSPAEPSSVTASTKDITVQVIDAAAELATDTVAKQSIARIISSAPPIRSQLIRRQRPGNTPH